MGTHLAEGIPELLRLLPPLARLRAPGAPDWGVIKPSRLGFPAAAIPSASSCVAAPLTLGELLQLRALDSHLGGVKDLACRRVGGYGLCTVSGS